MGLTLAIDFGSTYTKLVAMDFNRVELVGVTQAESTVDTDITIGLRNAIEKLQTSLGVVELNVDRILACSSAAGGLRVVAVGLVRQLTTKAAEEAALGAGAKIVGTYSYGLSEDDIKHIEQIAPDIILLTGGTDGGNEKFILHNAGVLAASEWNGPIVVAGNKQVTQKVRSMLETVDKSATVVDNVLPELNELNVEPARIAIREIFMRRITHSKGLDKAQSLVGEIIMPTPMAVLQGTRLIAEGAKGEPGLGDLIVVDVGGATTDVYSIADGSPTRQGVVTKGLPEPYAKRTVEGDLGIRYNAKVILRIAGEKQVIERINLAKGTLAQKPDLSAAVEFLSCNIGTVPRNEVESCIDIGLASTAVDIATRRHAGSIEEAYFPTGKVWIQYGKDLTNTRCVIGTGGIFAYGEDPLCVIKTAGFDRSHPESLRPVEPEFYIDKRYILYAVGLTSQDAPLEALKILKKHLKPVSDTAL
jgi:uncharacterized protein (TIGR01319 family)